MSDNNIYTRDHDNTVQVKRAELEMVVSSWARKCAAQEKEIARLHKIIELMHDSDNTLSFTSLRNMAHTGVNENGMVCDCCECAPCICEGDDHGER